MEVYVNNKHQVVVHDYLSCDGLKQYIYNELGLSPREYYLVVNGRRVEDHNTIKDGIVHVIPKVFGGKGGFGSMLRAIGAQIEKTTNREACRDLSGRRLRDINEEQRLKNWINQQAEREKEAKERKKKKLEKLCEKPRHEFKDEEYDKERSELPEKVEDALLQGLQASCSSKRKTVDKKEVVKKKKSKLWVDDELDDDLSSSDGENEESNAEENKNSSDILRNSQSEISEGADKIGESEENADNSTKLEAKKILLVNDEDSVDNKIIVNKKEVHPVSEFEKEETI